MNAKAFLILLALTAAAAAGAWFLVVEPALDEPGTLAGTGSPALLEDLAAAADDLTRIEIESAGTTVALDRDAESPSGWRLASRAGYPADAEAIRRLVTALGTAEIAARKTSNPEYHGRLGVDWPAPQTPPGATTRVRFEASGDTPAAEVIVGKRVVEAGSPRTYVRRLGEDRVWLLDARINASTDGMQWLVRSLFEIDGARVDRVDVRFEEEGAGYTIVRAAGGADTGEPAAEVLDIDTDLALETLPPDTRLKDPNPLGRIAGALGFLTFTNVRSQSEEPLAGDDPVTAVFETTGGLAITARTADEAGEIWATFDVAGEGEEAARLRARTEGFVFRLSQFNAGNLRRPVDELVESTIVQQMPLSVPDDIRQRRQPPDQPPDGGRQNEREGPPPPPAPAQAPPAWQTPAT